MNDNGYVKLYRKILNNPIVCKDSDHLSIWCYLLLNATHKEIKTLFKGEKISLLPGQLITGRKVISKALKIDESKIQRVLSCFESEHQIEQQTSNKNRLISIVNWEEYQTNEQLMNNKCTTSEQQVNTNKNVNNVNNVINNKKEINNNKLLFTKKKFEKPTLEAVEGYCKDRQNNVDAQRFYDYYESNGWKVGKNPMKDWKASVRTWERNENHKISYEEKRIKEWQEAGEKFLRGE